MNNEGVKSVFVQMFSDNYGKEGKVHRSFNAWAILRKGNLIVHFYDWHHHNQKILSKTVVSRTTAFKLRRFV